MLTFDGLAISWCRPPGGRKRTLTPAIDAFNVLNRVNSNQFVGNLSSPFFGRALSAQPARRLQFSLRLRY